MHGPTNPKSLFHQTSGHNIIRYYLDIIPFNNSTTNMQYSHYRQRHLFLFDVSGYMFRHQLCAITKSRM